MIVQRCDQLVILLHVEDVNETIAAARRQEHHVGRRSTVIDAEHLAVMSFENGDLLEQVQIENANISVPIADGHR